MTPLAVIVHDLVRMRRKATAQEIDQIVQVMLSAPFPTSRQHWAKRLGEAQWAAGTEENEYVDDLRTAIRDEAARLAVYVRRGGHLAAIFASTERVVPAPRRGPDWRPLLFVLYSADRDMIVSGYQASALEAISLPGDIQWLK